MFKAIIVDDETDIRRGLTHIVEWEKQGFIIVGEASNGLEALDVFKSVKPSLVVTDIRMPEMDGLALIKNLKVIDPNVKVIILSGYNDFTYAKEAMKYGVSSYLLKPVDLEEMNSELKLIRESIQERLLSHRSEAEKAISMQSLALLKLVMDEVQDENSFHPTKDQGLQLDFVNMAICVIEIECKRNSKINDAGNDLLLRKFALRNIVEEILVQNDCGYFFEIPDNSFGLLIGSKNDKKGREYFHRISAEIIHCVHQYADFEIRVGMGKMVKSVKELHLSYKQAQKVLERKLFSRAPTVFYYEETDELHELSTLNWDNRNLLQYIRDLSRAAASRELSVLFEELREKCICMPVVRHIITDILVGLAEIVLENNGDWKGLRSEDFTDIDAVLYNGNPEMIKKQMEGLFLRICDFIEAEKSKNSDSLIDRVVLYINLHYNEEISLKKLGDLFYINQFYMGQLLKKKKGIHFNDYLNRLRIENAKRLLQSGSVSIKEISERVGYKHVDHFYKNFKEIEGINPGEFVKGLIQE